MEGGGRKCSDAAICLSARDEYARKKCLNVKETPSLLVDRSKDCRQTRSYAQTSFSLFLLHNWTLLNGSRKSHFWSRIENPSLLLSV